MTLLLPISSACSLSSFSLGYSIGYNAAQQLQLQTKTYPVTYAPGANGTGEHETTSMVLSLMQNYVKNAETVNSIVSEGSELNGKIKDSVIFYKVETEEDSLIENSVVMQNALIKKGAKVYNAIIAQNVEIGENATTGAGSTITGNVPKFTSCPTSLSPT